MIGIRIELKDMAKPALQRVRSVLEPAALNKIVGEAATLVYRGHLRNLELTRPNRLVSAFSRDLTMNPRADIEVVKTGEGPGNDFIPSSWRSRDKAPAGWRSPTIQMSAELDGQLFPGEYIADTAKKVLRLGSMWKKK
ncbi:MAG: hypothetical protein KBA71_06015 [Opitutaceae bacterium]|nr:hypothetical protein [Opitutaceae bacterium]